MKGKVPRACYETTALNYDDTETFIVKSSLRRDGIGALGVSVAVSNGDYVVTIDKLKDVTFARQLKDILSAGEIAYSATQNMVANGRRRPTWGFLMPLGMGIESNKTLEVMDFPPDTLIAKRDYLDSNTTRRWFRLLQVNGVAIGDLESWASILDVAPIVAPARDGQELIAVNAYGGDFDAYTSKMLDLWTRSFVSQKRKPIVAFGSPIRDWLDRVYNMRLNVLDVGSVVIGGDLVPIMASNHPSYIFYAAHKYGHEQDAEKKNFELAYDVMAHDVVAACWQVEMGNHSAQDALTVKNTCKARWENRHSGHLQTYRNASFSEA